MPVEGIKIVSIIPYKIFPAQLGGEKGIAVFNEYLAEKVSMTVVTVKSNQPQYAKGYTLLNILSDSKLRYANLFLFFRLKNILIKEKATHLLIEHPYYGWLAWMLRGSLNIKWLVHSHNIEYMRSRSIGRWWWKALRWYEGWVYRKADRVFFISEEDRHHAISQMNVSAAKSLEVTYGIEQSGLPADILPAREKILLKHGIAPGEKILLFNGALYHSTNYDALSIILEKINPYLLQNNGFKYKILVCGKGLPDFFQELRSYKEKNVLYAGFVDDISEYFKAADIFLNPILSGGGVKTKAIEALAMDCMVVSTELGAMGIRRDVCGNKLHILQAGEWEEFADTIITFAKSNDRIPDDFFNYYYWGNIIERVIQQLA
ncbi:MAG: glycosyltransferase family 4 protein [Chitinophagaceae bacterium]|nr:glycosyltransferase family 4 protein [Chitinophagaceae bacterium]